jgi:hypothetical protein
MKRILKIILLAGSIAALTTSLRAQSAEDDAGTVTTDTGDAARQGKDEVKEPPGEPKGTNVTGAEESTEATVDPSDADKKDTKSSAGEKKTSAGSQK